MDQEPTVQVDNRLVPEMFTEDLCRGILRVDFFFVALANLHAPMTEANAPLAGRFGKYGQHRLLDRTAA